MNGIKNHNINLKMNICGLFSVQTVMGIDLLCQFVLMYIHLCLLYACYDAQVVSVYLLECYITGLCMLLCKSTNCII